MSVASLITTGRIIGAFALLLVKPLNVAFFIIFALCCVSDIFDGYIARKTKTTSRTGAILDSIADFIFVSVVLVVFIPLLAWENWMLYWIGAIAVTRFITLAIGYAKYGAFSFLHTYANKMTGIALALFPVPYHLFGLAITVFILCSVASLSAFEELIITILSKRLNRNITCIFAKTQEVI